MKKCVNIFASAIILIAVLAGALIFAACDFNDGENRQDDQEDERDERFESDGEVLFIDVYETFGEGDGYAVMGVEPGTTQVWLPETHNGKDVTVILGLQPLKNSDVDEFMPYPDAEEIVWLDRLYIPASMQSIYYPYQVFANEIEVDADNVVYGSVNNGIIEKSTNTLVRAPKDGTIPSTVSSIARSAYGYYSHLTEVELPDGITSIGDLAFVYCTGLERIVIPDSVTDIGSGAFKFCDDFEISYQGTISQWEAIDKAEWDIDAGSYVIECSDGVVDEEDPNEDPQPVYDNDDLGKKPNEQAIEGIDPIDKSKLIKFSEESVADAEVEATAAYLFNLANANLAKVDYYANKATGNGVATITIGEDASGSMEVREVRIKDGAAMYMETMGEVVSGRIGDGGNSSLIVSACRTLLDYGNRKYTPDGVTMYRQEGGTSCLDPDYSLNNFYTDQPYINWDECDDVESMTIQGFMKDEYYRNSYFETNSSEINAETLKEAKVTHNDAEGYYEIELVVDVTTNALTLATQSTRKSANSDDIVFVYQTIKCQVWDCGLFRYYSTDDSWEGSIKAGIFSLSGSSVNFWEKYFTYNKEMAPGLQIPTDMTWYAE